PSPLSVGNNFLPSVSLKLREIPIVTVMLWAFCSVSGSQGHHMFLSVSSGLSLGSQCGLPQWLTGAQRIFQLFFLFVFFCLWVFHEAKRLQQLLSGVWELL
ncbi:hypothetical protein H1C71_008007, partial [Ictidomys tridecemlineatus]